jgi:hypothetical protein
MSEVLHFSEDPTITRFEPHVPVTNPSQPPMVWAIDADHAPLYWFPRGCPRVAFWTDDATAADRLGPTTATRVHAVEASWLERIRRCELHVYRFDGGPFDPWSEADGHWVSTAAVTPISVEPVGDLLSRHADAGIELRIVPRLRALVDPVGASGYRFSMVRMVHAQG